jgi:hypothetical protein
VVLVIYLVAGILFMKYKRGATGKEVIPNVEFWSSLPGLIKVGGYFYFFNGDHIVWYNMIVFIYNVI